METAPGAVTENLYPNTVQDLHTWEPYHKPSRGAAVSTENAGSRLHQLT